MVATVPYETPLEVFYEEFKCVVCWDCTPTNIRELGITSCCQSLMHQECLTKSQAAATCSQPLPGGRPRHRPRCPHCRSIRCKLSPLPPCLSHGLQRVKQSLDASEKQNSPNSECMASSAVNKGYHLNDNSESSYDNNASPSSTIEFQDNARSPGYKRLKVGNLGNTDTWRETQPNIEKTESSSSTCRSRHIQSDHYANSDKSNASSASDTSVKLESEVLRLKLRNEVLGNMRRISHEFIGNLERRNRKLKRSHQALERRYLDKCDECLDLKLARNTLALPKWTQSCSVGMK